MPSEKYEVKGSCGSLVTGSIWKQGHSCRCKRRNGAQVRYWKPDREQYLRTKLWTVVNADILAEVLNFCNYCPRLPKDGGSL